MRQGRIDPVARIQAVAAGRLGVADELAAAGGPLALVTSSYRILSAPFAAAAMRAAASAAIG